MKKVIIFILLLFCCVVDTVYANTFTGPEIAYSYEIDADQLEFEVADTGTEHPFFEQFSVNNKNWYAVYYRYTKAEGSQGGSYERAYIEIYDSDGVLYKEISFDTTAELSIQLLDDCLNIYFLDHLITYTWQDDSLCGYHYSEPQQAILSELRYEQLTVGDWTYQSQSSMHGYTQLVRTNGAQTQTLIASSGSGFTRENTLLPALLLGAVCIAVAIIRKHWKGTRK